MEQALACLASSSGAADPMTVVFNSKGEAVVENQFHIRDVQAPGCHVCGHQQGNAAIPEGVHSCGALLLAQITMYGSCLHCSRERIRAQALANRGRL